MLTTRFAHVGILAKHERFVCHTYYMEDNKITPDSEKPTPTQQPASARSSKRWLLWLLVLLLVLAIGAAGYLWSQLKAANEAKQSLQVQLDQANGNDDAEEEANVDPAGQDEAEDEEIVACNDTPTAERKENIRAALDSKNTAAFATYFSNPVTFVLAASEKGGEVTPDQAAVDMEYANTATGPWDFNLPAATIDGYEAGFYADYFDANTYVGRAASGQVVAFDFDCDGKISKAFVAANEEILQD